MSSVGLAKYVSHLQQRQAYLTPRGTYNVGTGYVIKLTNPINVTGGSCCCC